MIYHSFSLNTSGNICDISFTLGDLTHYRKKYYSTVYVTAIFTLIKAARLLILDNCEGLPCAMHVVHLIIPLYLIIIYYIRFQ